MLYIDAPGNESENVTDSLSIYELDPSTGEMVGKGLLEADQLVSIKLNAKKNGLFREDIGGKSYFVSTNEDGKSYYLDPEELGVRGYLTGPRRQENFLKESLIVQSPDPSRPVQGLKAYPTDCIGKKCESENLPEDAQLKVIDAQIIKTKNEAGEEELKTYYSVKVEGKNELYWVQADDTMADFESSSVPDIKLPGDSDKDCNHKNDPIEDLINGAEDMKNSSLDQMIDHLLPHIGECFNGLSGSKDYINKVVPKLKKESVSGVTKDELVAIDLLSRTIYGEMASCNRHGSVYLNAVAKIIHNRKEYATGYLQLAKAEPAGKAKISRAKAAEFYDGKVEKVGGDFGPIILKPHAFSLWNKGDPAGKNAFCPSHPTRRSGGQDPSAIAAYKQAVRAAIKAVKYPDQLKKEMAPIKQHFYTSSIAMPSQHAYSEAKGVSTGIGSIDKKSCMRLWTSKRVQGHRKQLVNSGQLNAWLESIQYKRIPDIEDSLNISDFSFARIERVTSHSP